MPTRTRARGGNAPLHRRLGCARAENRASPRSAQRTVRLLRRRCASPSKCSHGSVKQEELIGNAEKLPHGFVLQYGFTRRKLVAHGFDERSEVSSAAVTLER